MRKVLHEGLASRPDEHFIGCGQSFTLVMPGRTLAFEQLSTALCHALMLQTLHLPSQLCIMICHVQLILQTYVPGKLTAHATASEIQAVSSSLMKL